MRILFAAAAFVLIFCSGMALAGNRQMVERQMQELDQLNRQMVEELGPVPSEGRMSYRGRALPQKEGYRFAPAPQAAAAAAWPAWMDSEGYERFGAGLRRYLQIPAGIVVRRGQEKTSDPGYSSFSAGLRRYLKGAW